jgi:hypothetical protein
MKTITLENGKKVKISEQSYQALAKSISDEEIIVPCSIAEYQDGLMYLRNVYDDINQFMFLDEDCFMVSWGHHWEDEPTIKMVNAKSISDIKVGDLVRYSDNDDWDRFKSYEDYGLRLVTEIDNNGAIFYQYWNKHGLVCYSVCSFGYWKKWQVSRPIND